MYQSNRKSNSEANAQILILRRMSIVHFLMESPIREFIQGLHISLKEKS